MIEICTGSTNLSGKIEMDVLLTNRCNLACKHCLYVERCDEKKDLSEEHLDSLLSQLEGRKAEVHLLGGEPLCRQDIVEVVKKIKKHGLVPKILTNGFALTKELFNRLIEAGMQEFGVSVDGTECFHNINRGNDNSFAKVMNAIDIATQFGISPKVSCAVHRNNAESICDLLVLLNDKGVKRILIEHILPIGHGKRLNGQNLNPGEWLSFIERIKQLKMQKKLGIGIAIQKVFVSSGNGFCCSCLNGKAPVIDEFGKYYPCIILYAANCCQGNLDNDRLVDLLSVKNIRGFIEKYEDREFWYGRVRVLCPAVQYLLKTHELDLSSIKDFDCTIGCFHEVVSF